MQSKLYDFDGLTVRTELQPNGEFSAIDDLTYAGEGSPMGWGHTRLGAIVDLLDQMEDRGLLEHAV